MNNNVRLLLRDKIARILKSDKPFEPNKIASCLDLKYYNASKQFAFSLPLRSKQHDIRQEVPKLFDDVPDNFLESVQIDRNKPHEVIFQLNRDRFVKGLLDSELHKVSSLDLMGHEPKNILVEFSSPNIAKPFHVGHLRSTMIGNYVANINAFFKNDVKRINYLGDWGTQFGFVQLGLSLANVSDEEIKKDPMNALYNSYVYANKLAEEDPTVTDKAREIFRKLESGDESSFLKWKTFREYTLLELQRTYKRIGIKFDIYEWESMYSIKDVSDIIAAMEKLNLLVEVEGRKVVPLSEKRTVPIVKSDGSSLYITRDIAAAIERYNKHKFDTMYYVVDNAQTDHFINLIGVLKNMQVPWADRLQHVKFGKIRGMSTRKGTAVFLQDILDETKAVMKEKQIQSPTTKVNLDYEDPSTEALGLSAVIINDLKHKRNQDYEFDWNKALDIKGNTGVKLQYTHCRLVSLENNSGATIASECIPSLLVEPSADDLLYVIGKYDEAVIKSYQELEPYILVNYLFKLSNATGKALKELRIKGEPSEIANQRLLLMHTARKVLAQGMTLLGLKPLDEM